MIKQRETNSWKSVSYAKSISGAQTYTKFPIVLRTTEQSIPAWSVKGNMQQSGTPTQSSPITPQECGDMTENYFDIQNYVANITKHNCTVSVAANGVKITATGSDAYAGEAYKLPDRANAADRAAAIPVTENTTYVLSADVDSFRDCYISYLDSSYYALNTNYTAIGVNVPATFTTPTGTAYISLRLGSTSLGVGQSKTFANITLSKNGKYKLPIVSDGVTSNVYLSEPLRKIGDYADTIVADGTVTRVIKKIVFDGTEDWQKSSQASNGFYIIRSDIKYASLGYCNIAEYTTETSVYYTTPWTFRITNSFAINTDSTVIGGTTKEDWKTYLAQKYANGTPVCIFVESATATTETVTMPTIPTISGLNTIDVATQLKPSEMSLTYDGYKLCKGQRYSRTENLFDYTTMSDGVEDAYLAEDGSVISATNIWCISDYIPCDGTSFTINPIGGNEPSICLYDENKTYITGKAYMTGGANTKRSISITATSSAKYIRFTYRKSTASYPDDLSEIMLNSGSTAKPYQPYLNWE